MCGFVPSDCTRAVCYSVASSSLVLALRSLVLRRGLRPGIPRIQDEGIAAPETWRFAYMTCAECTVR